MSSFQFAIEQRIMQDMPPEVVAQRPLNGQAHINKHFQEAFDFMLYDVPRPRQFMCLLEQFTFQVKLLSIMSVAQTLWNGHRTTYDFLLRPNLVHAFEMVSNMLTGHAQLDFWHDDCLPEVINGDMEMLLLAVKTLAEFSLKFSVPAERVIVRSALDRLSGDDDCYDVSFNFSLAVNPKFDHDRICQMIGVDDPFGLGSNTNDINNFLLQRAITYQDYLEEFGIGLLILPCLVNLLDGKIEARFDASSRSRSLGRSKSCSGLSMRSAKSANDGSVCAAISITLMVPLH